MHLFRREHVVIVRFLQFLQKKNADWLLKNAVNGGRSTEEYRTAEFEKRAQEYRATEVTFTQKIKRNGSKENLFCVSVRA